MSELPYERLMGNAPHLKTWRALHLGQPYRYIEPNSAVGRLVAEQYQTLEASNPTREAIRGWRGEASLDYQLAYARVKVLHSMYFDVLSTQHDGLDTYENSVEGALARGVKKIEDGEIAMPPDSQSELIALNQEIATFLWLESDLHFCGLDSARI